MNNKSKMKSAVSARTYNSLIGGIESLLKEARSRVARSINSILTATYWEIGRRIVEFEQKGEERAVYGERLLRKLSTDLSKRFGRGFGYANLNLMRQFFLAYPSSRILQTPSGESYMAEISKRFPLSWSHYVRLLTVENNHAREFYETEAIRGGWSVRQLNRQISSLFYERTALSRNKAAMLLKGSKATPEDMITPEEEIKDPYVLEFLDLKDEYSERNIEEALISHLEKFLLELGGDFTFIGRQKRLKIGDEWFRVDLLFFHRRLRCLVIIDLKADKFTHADVGQMHMYLNYAKAHWTLPGESPPVGLILCTEKNSAVAKYALEGLPNKVLASEYKPALPDERLLVAELEHTRKLLESRKYLRKKQ